MVSCYVVQSCKFLYIVLSGGGSCRPEGQGKRSMLLGIMEVRVLRKLVNGLYHFEWILVIDLSRLHKLFFPNFTTKIYWI